MGIGVGRREGSVNGGYAKARFNSSDPAETWRLPNSSRHVASFVRWLHRRMRGSRKLRWIERSMKWFHCNMPFFFCSLFPLEWILICSPAAPHNFSSTAESRLQLSSCNSNPDDGLPRNTMWNPRYSMNIKTSTQTTYGRTTLSN